MIFGIIAVGIGLLIFLGDLWVRIRHLEAGKTKPPKIRFVTLARCATCEEKVDPSDAVSVHTEITLLGKKRALPVTFYICRKCELND